MRSIFYTVIVLLLVACGSKQSVSKSTSNTELSDGKYPQILANEYAFLIKKTTTDKTYGYDPNNAIKVGGASAGEGPTNERRFLNALAGPNGEGLNYSNVSST